MSRQTNNQRNINPRNRQSFPTIQLLFQHPNCLSQISYQIQYQYRSNYQSSNEDDYDESSHFTYQYSSHQPSSQIYHQQFSNSEAGEQYSQQIEAVETNCLSIDEINRIPLMTWTNLNKKYNSDEKCSVCIENFKQQQKIKVLACLHRFHLDCLDTWLQTKKNCPTCRTTVQMKDFD